MCGAGGLFPAQVGRERQADTVGQDTPGALMSTQLACVADAHLRLRLPLLVCGLGVSVAGAKRRKAQRRTHRGSRRTIVGSSPALLRCLAQAKRLAPRSLPVLIQGPTGCGKEGVAKLMTEESGRPGAYIPLNCAALPEHLIESELFGHERGAFTGARERREGLFESAQGGTLLLDEIGEMPPSVQSKLLRVLEVKAIRRVGGTQEIPVDVRILASTHRDLRQMVQEGRFREDLFYRLCQGRIVIPPLKERGSDIETLARHFLREFAQAEGLPQPRLSRQAGFLLGQHDWPGNARELKALMAHLMIGEGIRRIEAEHVILALDLKEPSLKVRCRDSKLNLEERVLSTLDEDGWVRASHLRQVIGVSKGSLQRSLKSLSQRGLVLVRGEGRGRIYGPSHPAPREAQRMPAVEEHKRKDDARPAILRLAGTTPTLKRADVVDGLGLTPRTASRLLRMLVVSGALEREGEGRGVVYRLVS